MADITKIKGNQEPVISVTDANVVVTKKEKVKFSIPPLVTVNGEAISNCYTVLKEFRTEFNAAQFDEKIAHVLLKYDFIVGDYVDNQLRLKGFYRDGRRDVDLSKRVSNIERYIKHSCNYMSPYYVLEKTQRVEVVEPELPPKKKLRNKNAGNSSKHPSNNRNSQNNNTSNQRPNKPKQKRPQRPRQSQSLD